MASEIEQFYDDFDVDYHGDLRGDAADALAREILIPGFFSAYLALPGISR